MSVPQLVQRASQFPMRASLLLAMTWTCTARLAVAQRAPALAPAPVADTADVLDIDLLTIGQGDQVWEKFGHNALVVTDRRAGTSVAWNWGLFDFNQPGFIRRFLTGETRYRMDGFPLDASIDFYKSLNRTVWIQRLALNAHYKRKLRDLILENAKPENREYPYDYFIDNCSTRIRNLLNEATGGGLAGWTRHHFSGAGYLFHTQRLVADNPLTALGVTIALGRDADRAVPMWEEMFIPRKLQERVRELEVEDGRGGIRRLVATERTLFTADRAPELGYPPLLWPWCAGLGLLIGAGLLALARAARNGSRSSRVMLATGGALWLAVAGIIGVILILAATMTRHVFWQDNPSAWLLNAAGVVSAAAFPHLVMRPGAGLAWLGLAVLAPLASFVGLWQLVGSGMAPRLAVVLLVIPVQLAVMLALVILRLPTRTPGARTAGDPA